MTRTALQVKTGVQPRRAPIQIMGGRRLFESCTIDRSAANWFAIVRALQTSLEALHTHFLERIDARRQRAIDAHKNATNIVTPDYIVRDFVVICKLVKYRQKNFFIWAGPRLVIAVKGPAV